MTADSNEALATGAARTVQCRQKIDIDSDKVLEEIWHTADREIPTFSFRRRYSLFGNVCTTLIHMKDDALGVCLCCREPIGFKRLWKTPWTPLCIRCQKAADRNDGEILRSRSRG